MENKELENKRLAHSTERSGFDAGVQGDDQAGIQDRTDGFGQATPTGVNPERSGQGEKPWGAQSSQKGDYETGVIGEELKT